ncbi:MAG: restriction endonuclease subunit S, partial [Ruminiclostridium sp.]|nr:restriction endonuclease subunit S [Ruminiclostridium sp.]
MAKLSAICEINMGQSPESSSYNEVRNGLPFFQGNADFGEIHPSVRVWCTEPKKIAKCNDILISVRAPIGALNIANIECCIGRGLAALTVNDKICSREFLWYALESNVDLLVSKGTGSTFKAIGKNVLYDLEIPLPPLETQKQIAAILDKVTDLINKRKQQLE